MTGSYYVVTGLLCFDTSQTVPSQHFHLTYFCPLGIILPRISRLRFGWRLAGVAMLTGWGSLLLPTPSISEIARVRMVLGLICVAAGFPPFSRNLQ